MPDLYRLKTTVEAMQLIPGTDNYKDICDWIHGVSRGFIQVNHDGDRKVYFESPLAGDQTVIPGDWVILHADGVFRHCPSTKFARIYEPLEGLDD